MNTSAPSSTNKPGRSPIPFPQAFTVSSKVTIQGCVSAIERYFKDTVETFLMGAPLGFNTIDQVLSVLSKSTYLKTEETMVPDRAAWKHLFTCKEMEFENPWLNVEADRIKYVFPNTRVVDFCIVIDPTMPPNELKRNFLTLRVPKRVFVIKVGRSGYVGERFSIMAVEPHRGSAKEFPTFDEARTYIDGLVKRDYSIQREIQICGGCEIVEDDTHEKTPENTPRL